MCSMGLIPSQVQLHRKIIFFFALVLFNMIYQSLFQVVLHCLKLGGLFFKSVIKGGLLLGNYLGLKAALIHPCGGWDKR